MSKIRIMHVNSTRSMGGTERMLTHLIPNFDSNRFESCLVCFNSPSEVTSVWENSGIKVYHLNIDKSLSIKGSCKLFGLIRKWRPDVLMVYGLRANLMARPAAWLCRVPAYITCQRGIEDWKNSFQVFLEKATSIFVDVYIGNSQACSDQLMTREKIPPRKLQTIHNGIKLSIPENISEKAQRIRKDYDIPAGVIVIGGVGRLQGVKGQQHLISAAKEVLEKYPDVRFVILGKDFRNGELQKLTRQLGIQDKVLFPGHSEDVISWLKCFDIFVLPSLSEGMPVAVLEAMFMKLPIIATSVGGVREVVIDGESGIIVPPGQPKSLAKQIIALIEDSQLRQKLANGGFIRASKHFTAEEMTQKYQDAVLALLRQKGKLNNNR